MIDKCNVILKKPDYYIIGEIKNPEVRHLLDSITDYFNQENIIYDAELTVSNNTWEPIPNQPGAKKRKDITFTLSELTEIIVYPTDIKFKVGYFNKTYEINITKDFFYFFEWERAYYD